jgi:hypothetical protein
MSDSYDPEFGTGENAAVVREAVEGLRDQLTKLIGSKKRLPIVSVIESDELKNRSVLELTERSLRIMRFAVDRALESL